jgi:hypothetical protein
MPIAEAVLHRRRKREYTQVRVIFIERVVYMTINVSPSLLQRLSACFDLSNSCRQPRSGSQTQLPHPVYAAHV